LIACALIPVVTLGGGLPALIGFAGVGGTLSVSRLNRWSVALRAGVCGLITLACWGSLALLATTVVAVKAVNQTIHPIASTSPTASSQDKHIHDIGVACYKHGYLQSDIDQRKDRLYDECDQMQPAQCVEYLQKALAEARNSPDIQ